MARPAHATRALGLLVLVAAVLTASAPTLVRVQPGDTLSALARRHHTSVATLQALNHMGGSTTIYAGTSLAVPGAAPAPAEQTTARTTARTEVRTYTVRPGDGLIVVARALHTDPATLVRLNHLRRTYLIVGELLRYPVRVAAPAPPPTGTAVIPGPVARAAAAHRATLSSRALPSTSQVRSLIAQAARRDGVPTDLALALSYQESGFQQRVVSAVDAVGAMQVLPSTARSLGLLHSRTFDLLDAVQNVEAGVLLLHDLLDATGDVPTAIAGYYQGLGSLARVGVLPETAQYVRNVLALRHRFA